MKLAQCNYVQMIFCLRYCLSFVVLILQLLTFQKYRDDLAKTEVHDTGKPLWEAEFDIDGCADTVEYYAGLAPTIAGSLFWLTTYIFAVLAVLEQFFIIYMYLFFF